MRRRVSGVKPSNYMEDIASVQEAVWSSVSWVSGFTIFKVMPFPIPNGYGGGAWKDKPRGAAEVEDVAFKFMGEKFLSANFFALR